MERSSYIPAVASYLLKYPGLELGKAIDLLHEQPELRERVVTVLEQVLGGPLSFQLITSGVDQDIMEHLRDLNGFADKIVTEVLKRATN